MRSAAIFDIDHTLLKGSTAGCLGRYMLMERYLPLIYLFRIANWSMQYKMGKINVNKLFTDYASELCAIGPERFYWEHSQQTFQRYIKKRLYRETYDKIQEHKKQGHVIILASSSPEQLVKQVADFLEADYVIGLKMEYTDGYFNGNIIQPLPLGEGKKYWVEKLCHEEGIDLMHSYFYSDSDFDLPLLNCVGFPVATNPNRRLRQVAKRNSWEILRCKEFLRQSA